MTSPLQIIGDAMRAEMDTVRAVSVNVANAGTTGFRRQIPIVRPAQNEFDQLLNGVLASSGSNSMSSLAIDLQQGPLKSTSTPTHLALDGPGFFVLEKSGAATDSSLLVTRRGDFHVSAAGYLAAINGELVLGTQGPIQVGGAEPIIAADGTVRIDDVIVDQLRVVQVGSGANLESLNNGTFKVAAGTAVEGEQVASVRQGFLEASNVDATHELLQLMESLRRFETEQKFILAYDGMMDKAINEMGKGR